MKKLGLLFFAIISVFALTACSEDTMTTYDGNEVVTIETATFGPDYYVEVTDPAIQEEILLQLDELAYTEAEPEEGVHAVMYQMKLTYSDGSGVVFDFYFDESLYSITPFDAVEDDEPEQSTYYVGSDSEMTEFKKLFDL